MIATPWRLKTLKKAMTVYRRYSNSTASNRDFRSTHWHGSQPKNGMGGKVHCPKGGKRNIRNVPLWCAVEGDEGCQEPQAPVANNFALKCQPASASSGDNNFLTIVNPRAIQHPADRGLGQASPRAVLVVSRVVAAVMDTIGVLQTPQRF
jgi:hypothetical protein